MRLLDQLMNPDPRATGRVIQYGCVVQGSRNVTLTNETQILMPPNQYYKNPYYLILGDYNVQYSGAMEMMGRHHHANGKVDFPSSFPGIPNLATVTANINYDAKYGYYYDPATGQPKMDPNQIAFFDQVSNINATALGINVSAKDLSFSSADGNMDYVMNLSTANPNNIVNNGVDFSGTFRGTGEKIIFGKIDGRATLVTADGYSVLPDQNGGNYLSLAQLQYDVTPTILTQLDENELITPTIAVTDGINMNGSQVTNLGDGVAPTDAVNKRQLDAETSARQSADLAISQRIDTISAGVIEGLTNETNARIAADIDLTNRINAVGARIDHLEGRIDRLDDQMASSTATAMAMGGTTFLPDMKFNLSANMATYDGAHAGSLSFGALVSPNVAVNAGVASGFNKRGKTGGRVGVTIGW